MVGRAVASAVASVPVQKGRVLVRRRVRVRRLAAATARRHRSPKMAATNRNVT